MRWYLLLLLSCFSSVTAAEEKPRPKLGLWSWSQESFVSSEAREKLLSFCVKEKIKHIDQHIRVTLVDGSYQVANQDSLQTLLQEASQHTISINALLGERTMFFEKHQEATRKQLEAILNFNRSLPESARFAGIKYDVEPYLTPEWKAGDAAQQTILRDYLSFLQQAKALLLERKEELELAVDVPFWWDNPEFTYDRKGEKKPFVHHILEIVDWIGIMSYRRDSAEVMQLTEQEFQFATAIGKPRSISPGLEVAVPQNDPEKISFHGTPVEEFRATIAELQEHLTGVETARFIMIHDYRSLVRYLSKRNAVP